MAARTTAVTVVLLLLVFVAGLNVTTAARRRHTTIDFGGSNMERGSGRMITEQRDVGAFSRIESNVGADIMVSIGTPQSVSLTYDDNLIDYVTTKVRGGRLVLESSRSFSSSRDCRVKIVVPRLEEVSVGGSGNIEVIELEGDRLAVNIDGSADVTATGAVGELDVEVNGSGDVDTRDLVAGEVSVEINGSGNVSVMARDYLTVTINGSGDVIYTGDPGQVVKRVEGSGRIRKR